MAGCVNKVILIGVVGADPEIREANGKSLALIRFATTETWRDKVSGDKKERTEWHRIVVYNEGLVKLINSYVHKGSKLYLEGQIHTRKWKDKDGNDKYSTEIVLQRDGKMTMLSTPQKKGFEQKPRESREQSSNNYDRNIDDPIPF
jgi:single-strand DNA-binding protein